MVNYAEDLKRGDIPIIDLSDYQFIDIAALTYLMSFCCAAKEGKILNGITPSFPIKLPHNQNARQYIFKTNFFSFASLNEIFIGSNEFSKFENIYSDNNRYPYIPFKRIVFRNNVPNKDEYFENDCQKFVNQIVEVFYKALVDRLGFSVDMANNFWEPNKEIFENIYKHSDSWGFSIIQCFQKEVIICYADIGFGVMHTLNKYQNEVLEKLPMCREWNDGSAILGAFLPRLTCLPGKSRGLGLFYLENYINKYCGTMEYRSGRAKVILKPNKEANRMQRKGTFVEYIPGVQISIKIPAPWR
ncbi:hypothetical protein ACFL0M_14965 [Thermodesulfobacteriota bacterium]